MEKGEKKLRRLRAQKTRLLRIGCPFLILQTILTPKLAHLHHRHSEVEVWLTIENWMQLMLDPLHSTRINLLFLATPAPFDPLLSEHDIGCFRYSFFASRKNFGTLEGRTLSLEDLSRLPMVILRSGNNTSDCLGIRHCGTATAGKRQDRHPVLHRGVYPGGLRGGGGGLSPSRPCPRDAIPCSTETKSSCRRRPKTSSGRSELSRPPHPKSCVASTFPCEGLPPSPRAFFRTRLRLGLKNDNPAPRKPAWPPRHSRPFLGQVFQPCPR